MKILAIDTTSKTATAALCEDGTLISSYTQNAGLTHSETMLKMVESILENARTDIDDIDIFACSTGPGSFTGVRIGVSVIKGLAFAKEKPCIGVSALEALAHNILPIASEGDVICPVMDARREQLYNAIFAKSDGKLVRLSNDDITSAGELAKALNGKEKTVRTVGDGSRILDPLLKNCITSPELLAYPAGYSVAQVALAAYNLSGEDKAAFTDTLLAPQYLRPSQAERNAQNNKGEK